MLGSSVVERAAGQGSGQAGGPGRRLDLRRGVRRELAETLVERAALLPEHDRCLIEGVFRDGRTIADLAAIWDRQPGATPRILRRRVHKLVERLCSPAFVLAAHHRDRWSPPMRRVATACVLHGKPLREAADSLGMSLHTVRRHFDAVQALADAWRTGVRTSAKGVGR